MNILIVGGSGFVSGTLANVALQQGHKVWTVTRGERQVPAGVNSMLANRQDTAMFEQVITAAGVTWDVVIDCIGFKPEDTQQDLTIFSGLASHLIFISTDFVFDPAHRRLPQAEASEHYLAAGYGGQKRQCELVLINSSGDLAWTVVRPCHIYGPGSLLGCLPQHGRDPGLIDKLKAGEPLQLVGGGYFLQQPILARDLAELILSMAGLESTQRQIFCAAGPDLIQSRDYYQIIASALGVPLTIAEVPVTTYLTDHPESAPFLCHRIYDLTKLRATGVAVPATPIEQGLQEHVQSLLT